MADVTVVDTDVTWINASGGAPLYDAGEVRRADAAMLAFGGVALREDDATLLSVDASDVVTVQPFSAAISAESASEGAGFYRGGIASSATASLSARDETNGRVDLIVFRALDPDVVGTHTARTGRVQVLTGTPSATPSALALPDMAVELGRISVPAAGGAAGTVDISHRSYACAVGGVLPVRSSAVLPAMAPLWQRAVSLSTGREYRYNGSAWGPLKLSGVKSVAIPGDSSNRQTTVTFTEAFTSAPKVLVNPSVTGPGATFATATSITTTGFTLNYQRTAFFSSGTIDFDWVAEVVR